MYCAQYFNRALRPNFIMQFQFVLLIYRKKSASSNQRIFCGIVSPPSDLEYYQAAFKLGQDLANSLVSDGALSIMEEARKANEAS